MLLHSAPPGLPKLPNPRGMKIGVLVALGVVYVVLFVTLSRHPRPHGPVYAAIPVAVVKTARQIPPPPPLTVQLHDPAPVTVPPPALHLR